MRRVGKRVSALLIAFGVFAGSISVSAKDYSYSKSENSITVNEYYKKGFIKKQKDSEVSTAAKDIAKICGLHAKCETDINACIVDVNNDHNPYDVQYDYGELYNDYVAACDWSLVFDADYYMETFPLLALQYNYDEDLLLEHFQTVGVHEGRQGTADFNVVAYKHNCDDAVYETFKKNYEGYYFYYMLNYDSEKYINTKTSSYGKEIYQQYKQVYTKMQSTEFAGINMYREEVNSQDIKYDSEVAALANFRAYINSAENWDAHDWAIENNSTLKNYIKMLNDDEWKYGENNITSKISSISYYKLKDWTKLYHDSKEHYNTMVATKYNYVGVSNFYVGINEKKHSDLYGKYEGSQFDVYLNDIRTPMHD